MGQVSQVGLSRYAMRRADLVVVQVRVRARVRVGARPRVRAKV